MNLSVIILTYNEELNLPGCLASLSRLNAYLIVVDSGSTDRTVEIATKHGAKVFTHPFENYSAQRNWAQTLPDVSTPWVLHLDADERLTPPLVDEINALSTTASIPADGFLINKRTVFRGRWIRHGGHYPSYHLRLFRKDKGRCENRLYDQHFVVDGRVARLKHDYIDVVASNISTWSQRHIRWAEMEAREIFKQHTDGMQVCPRLLGNPIERKRWFRQRFYQRWPLFVRPLAYWIYRYFFRLGFLDGKQGFIFHFLHGFWFRLLVDINLDELREQRARQT